MLLFKRIKESCFVQLTSISGCTAWPEQSYECYAET